MIKICFVTAARSEYSLLKWIMQDIQKCADFQLQLVVTGGHLSYEQGHTIESIIEDGFSISRVIDIRLDTSNTLQIAESMGRLSGEIAKAFEELTPDYLVVEGDRYELLSICSTAFIMKIPIIHISGGDKTEGAIDDNIRNAITMLADYHFPGTTDSAQNIIRMRGTDRNVWAVGEPGLDAFYREKLLSREELAFHLGLDTGKRWVLMTYHAETRESLEQNLFVVRCCIENITKYDAMQTVITYANADFGGKWINEYIKSQELIYPEKIFTIPSLGHLKYLSLMSEAVAIVGNSSSGIVEAPFLGIPVINIGNRQKGRYLCGNVLQCEARESDIKVAIKKIETFQSSKVSDRDYYGDGHTSEKILKILKQILV